MHQCPQFSLPRTSRLLLCASHLSWPGWGVQWGEGPILTTSSTLWLPKRPVAWNPWFTKWSVQQQTKKDVGVAAVLSQRSAGVKKITSLCIFNQKKTCWITCWEKLCIWQMGTTCCEVGIWGMETLAGGSRDTFSGLNWPQEPCLHPDGLASELPSGSVGLVLRPFKLHPHLPSGQQEHQARRSLQTAAPVTILPTSFLVASLTWEIRATVRQALVTNPDSGSGPPGCSFVPDCARSQVLQWGHTSLVSCHPGVARTLSLLCTCFWWRGK